MPLRLNVTFSGTVLHQIQTLPPPDTISGRLTLRYANLTITGASPMAITLPDDKPLEVQVTWVDSHGHVAKVDGPTTWASSDSTIVTVTVDGTDSTKATLSAGTGSLNTAQITASADADLGSGITTITAMADVTVIAGQAVAGTIAPIPGP